MRIGFVTDVDAWGGSEQYLLTVVEEAVRRGHETHTFCPAGHPFINDARRSLPAPVRLHATTRRAGAAAAAGARPEHRITRRGGLVWRLYRQSAPRPVKQLLGCLKEARNFGRMLKGLDFDLVQFGITGCPHIALGLRRASADVLVGCFCVMPSSRPQDIDLVHRLLEWTAFRCFDHLIANSAVARGAWVRRARISPDKVRVIHNGIDPGAFSPTRPPEEVCRSLGIPSEAPIVVVAARLAPRKGHRYLLRAMPRLLGVVPDAHLVLAGDGELMAPMKCLARDLGLLGRVHFLGHRTDMPEVMQTCDVLVLPTLYENFPLVLLEAMALEKATVASSVGGIPEIIQEGVTGHLVPPQDPKALAEALLDLLTHPEKARRFGKAGRKRLERRFALRRMLEETFALYDELLERKGLV